MRSGSRQRKDRKETCRGELFFCPWRICHYCIRASFPLLASPQIVSAENRKALFQWYQWNTRTSVVCICTVFALEMRKWWRAKKKRRRMPQTAGIRSSQIDILWSSDKNWINFLLSTGFWIHNDMILKNYIIWYFTSIIMIIVILTINNGNLLI